MGGSNMAFQIKSAGFTRPNDTTPYASGDLVANNTTAGSVLAVPLSVARSKDGSIRIPRVRLKKSSTVATNAQFRVHLFLSSGTQLSTVAAAGPTVTNGDNGAFVPLIANWIGSADITMIGGSDGCIGSSVMSNQSATLQAWEMLVRMNGDVRIFALVEARAAYTPTANEVFTVTAEVEQVN